VELKPILEEAAFSIQKKIIFNMGEGHDSVVGVINGYVGALSFFLFTPPMLWRLFPNKLKKADTDLQKQFSFCRGEIRKRIDFWHSASEEEKLQSNDIIMHLLRAHFKRTPDDPVDIDGLKAIVNDVYMASLETSVNVLSSVVYYLARYPNIQERMHEEIMQLVSITTDGEMKEHESVTINRSDVNQLEYLNAVLYEVERMSPVGPIIPRAASRDTELGGFSVARGSSVFVHTGLVHRDPTVWENPDQFDPDRFMGETGRKRLQQVYWFGLGARKCAGQNLGLLSVKLGLVQLFSKYRVIASSPEDKLTGKLKMSFDVDPKCSRVYVHSW